MSDTPEQPIRAHRETIWHLTCGSCRYYWTYPTMEAAEDIAGKPLHCPLCGTKSAVAVGDAPPGGG